MDKAVLANKDIFYLALVLQPLANCAVNLAVSNAQMQQFV